MPAKGAGTIEPHRSSFRATVVGAGIAGLTIALRLARGGAAVTLVDRQSAGQGATWAAGGMLAGVLECEPGEEALVGLSRWSQALWPDFAARLAIETGLPVGYRAEGTIQVAASRDELAALRRRHAWLSARCLPVEWIDGPAVREREPSLSPDCLAAIGSADDHQVDPRRLVPALLSAVRAAGIAVLESRPVAKVRPTAAGGWETVLADGAAIAGDVLVIAAGAWSATIDGLPTLARPPVRPAKGQALVLRMDRSAPLLRHVVWGEGTYLVPRSDGTLYLGATVEDRGFDAAPTAGGMLSLIEAAWRLLPGIEELPIAELVTGLRPRSRDDLPIVGPTGIPGLHVATGHHRNGILLAPATAELVAAGVLGEAPPIAADAFAPRRFAPARAVALA